MLSVGNGNSLAQALSIDSTSHLTAKSMRGNGGIGALSSTAATVRQLLPWTQLNNPVISPSGRTAGPTSSSVADVTAFGAIPGDNEDDTATIQRAIDSLPVGNGLPNTSNKAVGGIVVLPAGTFNTNGSIELPSGVWLLGQGAGTLIASNVPTGSSAIEPVSGATIR